jgi:hypothetical protein
MEIGKKSVAGPVDEGLLEEAERDLVTEAMG